MKYVISLFLITFFVTATNAQNVGIGTTVPEASAKLDISSTTQGFLPPRMTYAQRNVIQNPVAGLVLWCIDCNELQVYNGTIWKNMDGHAASLPSFPNVAICNQVWMVKNLDVSTYRNGDVIPEVTDPEAWAALTTGAWCYYDNDSATYAATYGKLYNWFAVNDPRGLAPAGWHVPSDSEWVIIENCLGGAYPAGGAMKETGTTHWTSPNLAATNSSGFTALPGGSRIVPGPFAEYSFQDITNFGLWWSSTEYLTNAWGRDMYNYNGLIDRYFNDKHDGLSVRCVRD